MSVIVRGMEMPDNCEDCAIQYDYMDCPVCGDGWYQYPHTEYECRGVDEAIVKIENVPSAQTEPLSDAYTKAVWTWLLDYQIKAAELKGRYTPYEVLSWVANDWRKEHERSDQQTGCD